MCYNEQQVYEKNVKSGVSCYQAMTIYYHKFDVFYVIHIPWIINSLSMASPPSHNYKVLYKPKIRVQSNILNEIKWSSVGSTAKNPYVCHFILQWFALFSKKKISVDLKKKYQVFHNGSHFFEHLSLIVSYLQ